MFSIKDKRQNIRFTKQISVTRTSNLPSKFHVLLIFWRKGTLTGGEANGEWGATMEAGGGALWLKKCPVLYIANHSLHIKTSCHMYEFVFLKFTDRVCELNSRGLMGLNFEWKSYTFQIQARNS